MVTYKDITNVLETYLSHRGLGRKLGFKKGESPHIKAIQEIVSEHSGIKLQRNGKCYSTQREKYWGNLNLAVSTDAWQKMKAVAQHASGAREALSLPEDEQLPRLEKAHFSPIHSSPRTATALIDIFDLYMDVCANTPFTEGMEWFGADYILETPLRKGTSISSAESMSVGLLESEDDATGVLPLSDITLQRQLDLFNRVSAFGRDTVLNILEDLTDYDDHFLDNKLRDVQAAFAIFTEKKPLLDASQEVGNALFTHLSPSTHLPYLLPEFAVDVMEEHTDKGAWHDFLATQVDAKTPIESLDSETLQGFFKVFIDSHAFFISANGENPSADIIREFKVTSDGILMRSAEAPAGSKALTFDGMADESTFFFIDRDHLEACLGFLKIQDEALLTNLSAKWFDDPKLSGIETLAKLPSQLLQPKYVHWINQFNPKALRSGVLKTLNRLARNGTKLHLLGHNWFLEKSIELLSQLNNRFMRSIHICGLNHIDPTILAANISQINDSIRNVNTFFDGIRSDYYFGVVQKMDFHHCTAEMIGNPGLTKALSCIEPENVTQDLLIFIQYLFEQDIFSRKVLCIPSQPQVFEHIIQSFHNKALPKVADLTGLSEDQARSLIHNIAEAIENGQDELNSVSLASSTSVMSSDSTLSEEEMSLLLKFEATAKEAVSDVEKEKPSLLKSIASRKERRRSRRIGTPKVSQTATSPR